MTRAEFFCDARFLRKRQETTRRQNLVTFHDNRAVVQRCFRVEYADKKGRGNFCVKFRTRFQNIAVHSGRGDDNDCARVLFRHRLKCRQKFVRGGVQIVVGTEAFLEQVDAVRRCDALENTSEIRLVHDDNRDKQEQ